MDKVCHFSFKSKEVSFEIHFTTPHHLSLVLYLVKTIIFNTFRSMCLTSKYHISLFPTILILKNTRIYISFLNYYNITSDIEASFYEIFHLGTVLEIPDINSDYNHIRFKRHIDDTRVESVICQVHSSGNYITVVILPSNHTSLPSTMATFLVTRLVVVMQPLEYSIFHDRDTPIQLSLPWQSHPC